MKLKEFLIAIANDPGKQETLKKYPAYALKDVDISDDTEKQALLSGNWPKIQKLVGEWDIIIYGKAQVTLLDFVRDLAKDAALRGAFESNPAGVLAHVTMPEQEKQMLLQQDWTQVRKELGDKSLPITIIDMVATKSQDPEK